MTAEAVLVPQGSAHGMISPQINASLPVEVNLLGLFSYETNGLPVSEWAVSDVSKLMEITFPPSASFPNVSVGSSVSTMFNLTRPDTDIRPSDGFGHVVYGNQSQFLHLNFSFSYNSTSGAIHLRNLNCCTSPDFLSARIGCSVQDVPNHEPMFAVCSGMFCTGKPC